ncbi:hypothetical protein M885DRAFT_153293 [Pelagophyceae sp. CCMP2097]|nr:hypothetical protein M885DRAFT_153293 [Pelagophyceae sp. CCMP2097]
MPIAQPGLAKLFAKLRGTHAEHAAAFQALEQAFDCEVASLARDRISLRGDLDALAGDRAVLAREVDALARDVALSQNVQEQLTSEANALQGDREALSQQFELSKEVEKHLVGEAAALEVDREALSQQMNLSLKVGQEFIDDAASQSDAARERASAHRAPDAARPCGVAASGGVGCGGTATGADVVVLNVGGVRFEASRIALERLDGSLLQKMFGRCGDTVNVDPCDGAVQRLWNLTRSIPVLEMMPIWVAYVLFGSRF